MTDPNSLNFTRTIYTGQAADIGMFSGREKDRIKLSGHDRTGKLAIAIFKEENPPGKQNYDWVDIKVSRRSNDFVHAEVSSLARRLNISKKDIRDAAHNGTLETLIQSKIEIYEKGIASLTKLLDNCNTIIQEMDEILNASDEQIITMQNDALKYLENQKFKPKLFQMTTQKFKDLNVNMAKEELSRLYKSAKQDNINKEFIINSPNSSQLIHLFEKMENQINNCNFSDLD